MQAQASIENYSYSLETMIRYAFLYEVQNKLTLNPNIQTDPNLKAVLEYMETRIKEITQKYK